MKRIALRAILPRTDTSSGHASGACRKGIKGLFRHPTSASAAGDNFRVFPPPERLVIAIHGRVRSTSYSFYVDELLVVANT